MAELKGIALGRLSMSIEEFEMMDIGVFFLKLFYANKKIQEDRQFFGNIMRLQTMVLTNIQLDAKSKLKDPGQLWKYDWDEDSEKDALTDEQKKERYKLLCSFANEDVNGKL